MNITVTQDSPASATRSISSRVKSTQTESVETQAPEIFTPSQQTPERGDLKTMLKRGLSFGSALGVPAALGATGEAVGERFQSEIGGFASSAVGAAVGQVYSGAKGAQAGWAIVPKQSAGMLLGVVTVPAGALAGLALGAATTLAGGLGGFPAAATLAGVGFAAGMVHGFYEPKVDGF